MNLHGSCGENGFLVAVFRLFVMICMSSFIICGISEVLYALATFYSCLQKGCQLVLFFFFSFLIKVIIKKSVLIKYFTCGVSVYLWSEGFLCFRRKCLLSAFLHMTG